MNHLQRSFIEWTLIGFGFGILIGFCLGKAYAADLAPPRIHAVKAVAHASEICLETGKNPAPGQTLQVDKTCKSGMRWVFQRDKT